MRIALLLIVFLYVGISKATELTVVTELWPPYNYLSPDGDIIGTSTDTVKQTLANANISYSLDLYPWARAYKMAQELPNTLIYSIFRTPSREKLFQWICPLNPPIKHYAFKLKSRTDINISSIDDLKSYKTSVIRDTFPHELVRQHEFIENKHYIVASSNDKNLELVLNGKIDLLIDGLEIIESQLSNAQLPLDLLIPAYQLDINIAGENCMAVSLATSPQLVEKIREAHKKTLLMQQKK